MAWGEGMPGSNLRIWLDNAYAQLGYNQTALSFQSALNRTGDALSALSAQHWNGEIRVLGSFLNVVPLHLLVLGHGLYTAANNRPLPFRPFWLFCFWISLMSGYGGGTITNLMLQEPFFWCRDDLILPIFALAWWFIMYCPKDIGYRVYNTPLLKLLCRLCAAVLRARVILSRLELAVLKFSAHSVMAPLFFGTLGGCAGKLCVDLALFIFSPGFRPPEILYPGWFLRSAFLISVWYMSCVHWLHILPQDVAFVMTVTALLAHGLTEELLGRPMDLTAPLGKLFHRITRIPEPPAIVRPPSGAASKKIKNGEYDKKVS